LHIRSRPCLSGHGRPEIRSGRRQRGHHHHGRGSLRRCEGVRAWPRRRTSGHRRLPRYQICLHRRAWPVADSTMTEEVFGQTADGEAVHRHVISGGGLTAAILTWGAVIQDLRLADHGAPLVLGFDTLDGYLRRPSYFGAIVGRCANRIAAGRFTIDGERFQADLNDAGLHSLHGGREGFAQRVWRHVDSGEDFVSLALHDPDGMMGFPGALDVTCTYRVRLPGTLSIELEAVCDAPTLCNLAHHSYFNLDNGGAGDILDHRLMINASAYLPV